MKAIQTHYKGCYFRSRLEARWAVFFDAMDIEWHYEPEGFELGDAGRYLPDFYLPKLNWWVEVKAQKLNVIEREKAFALSSFTNKPLIELQSVPEPNSLGYLITNTYYGLACRALQKEFLINSLVEFHYEHIKDYCADESELIWGAVQYDIDYYQKKYGKPHPRHFKNGVIMENEFPYYGSKVYNALIRARSARFEFGDRVK